MCHAAPTFRFVFTVFLAAFVAHASGLPAAAETHWLEPGRGFRPPLADPRETRSGAAWADGGDWTLRAGSAITIARQSGERSITRYGIDGGVWLWFQHDAALVFKLESMDGMFGMWIDQRRGAWSGRLRYGHVSAHLGDGVDQRGAIIYSREWIGFLAAYDASPSLRIYAGPGGYIRAEPMTKSAQFQIGGDWRLVKGGDPEAGGFRPYAALDLRWRAENNGRINQSYVIGVETKGGPGHTFRVLAGYDNGISERGQFWQTPEEHFTLGLSFSD